MENEKICFLEKLAFSVMENFSSEQNESNTEDDVFFTSNLKNETYLKNFLKKEENSFKSKYMLKERNTNNYSIKNTTHSIVNINKIIDGKDTKTTFMIRNIPNKYTQKMLIDVINKTNFGTYDFLYLVFDFKNKCNVGYAFINLTDSKHIIPLFESLNGKKWPLFNSEKKCSFYYAKIQGKNTLVEKFRNSKIMLERKEFQPKIFYTIGELKGIEYSFPEANKKIF